MEGHGHVPEIIRRLNLQKYLIRPLKYQNVYRMSLNCFILYDIKCDINEK